MAGLEGLIPLIYHETQQSGSMLCAQHALNSLLQGNYFTAPDLSVLANHLDTLERSYNEDLRDQASANMDDTGFFSVQVLENALRVWGLSLIRWRSEVMKPYQNQPHTQLAFVLNQNQHWYTLRRFGYSADDGHWFNLDSSKPSPQWIGKTYLGMFIQQAENDGYSVFAVLPIDPSNPYPLPRTDADDVASTLPEPSSASTSASRPQRVSIESVFEDEDMELQAALQASLASTEAGSRASSSGGGEFNRIENYPSPVIPSRTFPGFPPEFASGSQSRSTSESRIPPNQNPYGNADVDPVTASMERNRIIMERMRQEQEAALREQYEQEIEQFEQGRAPRHQAGARSDDEDDLFRRALEESLSGHHARTRDDVDLVGSDDEEDSELEPTSIRPTTHMMERVYDDDDADLQAALKASLETLPPGFTLPSSSQPTPPRRLVNEEPRIEVATIPDAEESEAETETTAETERTEQEMAEQATEEVNLEEMRRRRLARFGA